MLTNEVSPLALLCLNTKYKTDLQFLLYLCEWRAFVLMCVCVLIGLVFWPVRRAAFGYTSFIIYRRAADEKPKCVLVSLRSGPVSDLYLFCCTRRPSAVLNNNLLTATLILIIY